MKKYIIKKYRQIDFKKILSLFGTFAVISSFIFSTPAPTIKNELTRIAIEKIQQANTASLLSISNVAYAQDQQYVDDFNNYQTPTENTGNNQSQTNDSEDPNTVYGCTDSTAQNYNSSANTDDNSCTYQVWGCTSPSALNYNADATDDDSSCQFSDHCYDTSALNYGASKACTYPPKDVYGCTDSSAINYYPEATVDNGSCEFANYICCTEGKIGYVPPNQRGANDSCSSFQCSNPSPICCDPNWDNYTSPSDRGETYSCEYGPDTCQCYRLDDPFRNSDWRSHSACGGGNTDDGEDDNEEDIPTCNLLVLFSVTKSGVLISGTAQMSQPYPTDGTGAVIPGHTCSYSEDDSAYLAGRAAAAATPDTPLNTPIQLDSISIYTVTSKDYCLNILDVQGSPSNYSRNDVGFCCENPSVIDPDTGNSCINTESASCGSATGPYETTPTADLCSSGNPGAVTESDTSYLWSCNAGASNVSCSASRTCNGGPCTECTELDCGVNDVCKNVQGSQDSGSLPALNLSQYGNGECYNSTSGVCGSQTYALYATTDLTVSSPNLCTSEGSVSNSPTYNSGTNMWEWTCSTPNGGEIAPPTCAVAKCVGAECQTQATTGLIKTFSAVPAIVSTSADTCMLNWTTEGVNSSIIDPPQGCLLNNQPVSEQGSTNVIPGSYSLMCYVGEQFETRTARCSVKPSFREI